MPTAPPTRLRVLLLAEAANPEWTSVPLVGWSHSRAIAQRCDAHVVTQIRNRDPFLRAGLVEGTDFTAIDSEAIAKPVHRLTTLLRGGSGKAWTLDTATAALGYYEFERKAWAIFGPRIKAGDFDLVHRITPLSPTTPSWSMVRGCNRAKVPFIWGPINGGVPWPRGYDNVRRAEREWLSYIRDAHKLMPGYRATRRGSAAILVGSRDTLAQMPAIYRDKCIHLAENAIDPGRFSKQRTRNAAPPLRIVFVGRLVPYKGADVLIEAAADLAKRGLLTIEIIGDGPQMADLKAQVARDNLQNAVSLTGWVEHTQLQDRLIDADVLGFPSIREFGGGVVLEAMAVGLMPIVVDYGGPAELVTPQTGIAIPIGPRDSLVSSLRSVLESLVADPSTIDTRGSAARQLVLEQFTWDAKAAAVEAVYRKVLGR